MVELDDQKGIIVCVCMYVCVGGLRGVSPQHLFPFPAGFIKLEQKEKIMDAGLAVGEKLVSADTHTLTRFFLLLS